MSSDERRQSELSRPELPDVTRLNRNVLLVAGMGVGVVILAVTHVVRSDARPAAADSSRPPVEAGAVASFLREPPQGTAPVPVPPPAYPELGQDMPGATMEPATNPGSGSYTPAHYDSYGGSYAAPAARSDANWVGGVTMRNRSEVPGGALPCAREAGRDQLEFWRGPQPPLNGDRRTRPSGRLEVARRLDPLQLSLDVSGGSHALKRDKRGRVS
jgi:hypothetical protein